MMKTKTLSAILVAAACRILSVAAAAAACTCAEAPRQILAQPAPQKQLVPVPSPKPAARDPSRRSRDRAQAYYHCRAGQYLRGRGIASGQPEFMHHAIEEYKTALNADPDSPQLNDALADLYFRTGRLHEPKPRRADC